MGSSFSKARRRLDELLAERGLANSRTQAQALILAGKVRSGTEVLDKPGRLFPPELSLEVVQPPRFVSRSGEKLAGFLETHPLPVQGCEFLDVGASTGGFTDCLLQQGAGRAVCVDVGRAQLHEKLRQDPRVTNLERINARYLKPEQLPLPDYDLVVMDLSFISLTRVLSAVWPLLRPEGHLVALIKPQFEVDKSDADRARGIIRDPEVRERTVRRIRAFCEQELADAQEFALEPSTLTGTDGNQEYLIGLRRSTPATPGLAHQPDRPHDPTSA